MASRVSGKGQGRGAGKRVKVRIDYDLEREYVWVDVYFEGVSETQKKRVIKELSDILEGDHGLETWDGVSWEGDGVEISTVRKIKEKLEGRGYDVHLHVD